MNQFLKSESFENYKCLYFPKRLCMAVLRSCDCSSLPDVRAKADAELPACQSSDLKLATGTMEIRGEPETSVETLPRAPRGGGRAPGGTAGAPESPGPHSPAASRPGALPPHRTVSGRPAPPPNGPGTAPARPHSPPPPGRDRPRGPGPARPSPAGP